MTAGDPSMLGIRPLVRAASLSRTDRATARCSSLYEEQRDAIYRFLLRQRLPPAIAQEVTQDVFVKLFVALRRGTEVASDQAWLYGVAARSAVDYWRREGWVALVGLDGEDCPAEAFRSPAPSPEIQVSRLEQTRRVAQALSRLPKEQRLCVELRSHGLRYREIAQILGIGVTTVSDWLNIAVKRLRASAHD